MSFLTCCSRFLAGVCQSFLQTRYGYCFGVQTRLVLRCLFCNHYSRCCCCCCCCCCYCCCCLLLLFPLRAHIERRVDSKAVGCYEWTPESIAVRENTETLATELTLYINYCVSLFLVAVAPVSLFVTFSHNCRRRRFNTKRYIGICSGVHRQGFVS